MQWGGDLFKNLCTGQKMQDLYLYSTRCILREPDPSIRQVIDKTYCSVNVEPDKIELAQSFIPSYEKILSTKVFRLQYPAEVRPETGSPMAVSLLFNGCTRCQLCHFRKNIVHYRGFADAKIAFIGMAPGDEENKEGQPFVGPSGQLLESALNAAGFTNKAIIFNLVGCRPQDGLGSQHRDDPKLDEMIACSDRLWLTLNSVKPNFLLALGRCAAKIIFDEPKEFDRNVLYEMIPGKVYVAQCYHPSYILRVMKNGAAKELDDLIKFLRLIDDKVTKTKPFPKDEEWLCTREGGEFPFAFLKDLSLKKTKTRTKRVEIDSTEFPF